MAPTSTGAKLAGPAKARLGGRAHGRVGGVNGGVNSLRCEKMVPRRGGATKIRIEKTAEAMGVCFGGLIGRVKLFV